MMTPVSFYDREGYDKGLQGNDPSAFAFCDLPPYRLYHHTKQTCLLLPFAKPFYTAQRSSGSCVTSHCTADVNGI